MPATALHKLTLVADHQSTFLTLDDPLILFSLTSTLSSKLNVTRNITKSFFRAVCLDWFSLQKQIPIRASQKQTMSKHLIMCSMHSPMVKDHFVILGNYNCNERMKLRWVCYSRHRRRVSLNLYVLSPPTANNSIELCSLVN